MNIFVYGLLGGSLLLGGAAAMGAFSSSSHSYGGGSEEPVVYTAAQSTNNPAPAPEPASMVLLGIGSLIGASRLKNKSSKSSEQKA
jgi:hypothetical protein